jgi:hypothetical protein
MDHQEKFIDHKVDATNPNTQSFESLPAPPPPYPQAQAQKPEHHQTPPSYDSKAYPALLNQTQTPSRTLYVWYESWQNNDIHILDADHTTILYTVKLHIRKPQIIIHSASSGAAIATVNFNLLLTNIVATLNDSPIPLTSRGLLKNGHTWPSHAQGNATFTWKLKGMKSLVCEDEKGSVVARMTFNALSLRKTARLDMYGSEVMDDAFMEEILVTGMASMEYNAGLGNVCVFGKR